MSDYLFTYRCRYCGEKFTDTITGSEKLAFKCIIGAIYDKNIEPQTPDMLSVHFGQDHYGVADFIGCEIKENKE